MILMLPYQLYKMIWYEFKMALTSQVQGVQKICVNYYVLFSYM